MRGVERIEREWNHTTHIVCAFFIRVYFEHEVTIELLPRRQQTVASSPEAPMPSQGRQLSEVRGPERQHMPIPTLTQPRPPLQLPQPQLPLPRQSWLCCRRDRRGCVRSSNL